MRLGNRSHGCLLDWPHVRDPDSDAHRDSESDSDSDPHRHADPSPSPTATVTPTPTPTTTPTPTPSPTPGGPRAVAQPTQATLSASLRTDSQWPTGYCQTAIIRNTSTVNATSWTLTFDLPSGHTISQSWSGTATRSGNTVTVRPASWGATIAAGQTRSDFGFCVTR